MNEDSAERARLVESQTQETGDHFHGHSMPWELAKVAKFGDYTILVWASDRGEIPHFHVIRGRDLLVPDFEACIKMQCAEYYPHGDKGGDQLPEEQLGALVGLLNAKDECAGGEHTVWQSLIGIWNRNNKTRAIPLTTPMPDYRKIKWKLPLEDRPKRGTTILPDGSKVIYDGDLTVLDKDGELVSWVSSDLLSILWGDDEDEEDSPDASDEPAKNGNSHR